MLDKRFEKRNHLRKSSEFRTVFNKGDKFVTGALVFHVLRTDLSASRLGLAVSRRVGKAVFRNFVKRRIREAFREKKHLFEDNYDLIIYPRRGIQDKDFDDYLKSFETLIKRLRKKKKNP